MFFSVFVCGMKQTPVILYGHARTNTSTCSHTEMFSNQFQFTCVSGMSMNEGWRRSRRLYEWMHVYGSCNRRGVIHCCFLLWIDDHRKMWQIAWSPNFIFSYRYPILMNQPYARPFVATCSIPLALSRGNNHAPTFGCLFYFLSIFAYIHIIPIEANRICLFFVCLFRYYYFFFFVLFYFVIVALSMCVYVCNFNKMRKDYAVDLWFTENLNKKQPKITATLGDLQTRVRLTLGLAQHLRMMAIV